ncbi:MAG: acetyl-coenzyme A synthetase N-terminal domain-containing protein, partial [Phycisphaerales bacterium]
MSDSAGIESVLNEQRLFPPPSDIADRMGGAWIESMEDYRELHRRSIEDPEGFWSEAAREHLHWFSPFSKVLEWNCPDAKWFVGGTTNACFNCVDRQVEAGFGDEVAIVWEGEPIGDGGPEIRTLTYRDLQRETARFGNALKSLGVGKG